MPLLDLKGSGKSSLQAVQCWCIAHAQKTHLATRISKVKNRFRRQKKIWNRAFEPELFTCISLRAYGSNEMCLLTVKEKNKKSNYLLADNRDAEPKS